MMPAASVRTISAISLRILISEWLGRRLRFGELLEGVAAGRARASILSLTKLVPKTARLEENGLIRDRVATS